jgi:hypothetical protein
MYTLEKRLIAHLAPENTTAFHVTAPKKKINTKLVTKIWAAATRVVIENWSQ